MRDMLGDFARGTLLAVEKHISLAIKRFADSEQVFDFVEALFGRALQQRTMGLMADARENRFGRSPKAND